MNALAWNTLQDAVDFLAYKTGEHWTEQRVLDAALRFKIQLKAAPPRDTKLSFYRWDDVNGTPANPFVFQHDMHWQLIPLYPIQVAELLCCGETIAGIAKRPEDCDGVANEYVFVEPPLRVNRGMVGITGTCLEIMLSHAIPPGVFVSRSDVVHADAPAATGGTPEAKTGRPPTIKKKAEIVRQIVVAIEQEAGKKFDTGALPGNAADLLDACQRIEKAVTGKASKMTASAETFKDWLRAAGYSFPGGRTPKDQATFWTRHAPTTIPKINAAVFTGVIPDSPL